MATTTPTHVDTSIPELWAKMVLRDHKVKGYWGRFIGGEMSGSPIIQKSELLNKPGDLIHIQTSDPLTGAGVEGDTTLLEGSEENLATAEKKVSPVLYRHGVRTYRRAQKKSILDLRSEARMRLAEWGMNKMDLKRFELFTATALPAPLGAEAYTPNIYRPNARATTAALTTGDAMSVKYIQEMKLKLRINRARPINVDGRDHFIAVVHPYATFQLKQESRYESWVREAEVRGGSNPFFRGALAVVDGVILHDHENVTIGTSTVAYSEGIAFGQEAFVEGLDEEVSWAEDTFDYGNQFGIAYAFAFQPRRALELSSLQLEMYAPAV